MEQFLEQLINALVLGGIYALIAVGYTMVYGIIELINFAHGEIFMLGAYFALTLVTVGRFTVLGSCPGQYAAVRYHRHVNGPDRLPTTA